MKLRKLTTWVRAIDPQVMNLEKQSSADKIDRTRIWQIVAENLGWSLGWVSALDHEGRTIWIADAHSSDGKRFVVRADEKLTAFLEIERITCNDNHRNQTAPLGLESV